MLGNRSLKKSDYENLADHFHPDSMVNPEMVDRYQGREDLLKRHVNYNIDAAFHNLHKNPSVHSKGISKVYGSLSNHDLKSTDTNFDRIAYDSRTPSDVLDHMANNRIGDISSIAGHANALPSTLSHIWERAHENAKEDGDGWVRRNAAYTMQKIASNPKTPTDILSNARNHEDDMVRLAAFTNPKTSVKERVNFIKNRDNAAAIHNHAMNMDAFTRMSANIPHHEIKKVLSDIETHVHNPSDNDYYNQISKVRFAESLISKSNSPELHSEFVNHPDRHVREAAFQNRFAKRLTRADIRAGIKDPDVRVRGEAKGRKNYVYELTGNA